MPVLEVVIGVIFYFVTLSLVCSTFAEWWSRVRQKRGVLLEDSIRLLLGGQRALTDAQGKRLSKKKRPGAPAANAFLEKVLAHPLIRTRGEGEFPDSIEPQDFASAVLAVAGGDRVLSGLDEAKEAVDKIEEPRVREALRAMLHGSRTTVEEVQVRVADWFNAAMKETTSLYRRAMDVIVRWSAVLIVLLLNADALVMIEVLWRDPALRQSIVAAAENAELPAGDTAPTSLKAVLDSARADLAPFPLGWPPVSEWGTDPRGIPAERNVILGLLLKLVGWGFTVVAVSLGAPFWFDLLQKVLSLRRGEAETPKPPAAAAGGGA